jgi:polyisoprenoid-binding protein YceI
LFAAAQVAFCCLHDGNRIGFWRRAYALNQVQKFSGHFSAVSESSVPESDSVGLPLRANRCSHLPETKMNMKLKVTLSRYTHALLKLGANALTSTAVAAYGCALSAVAIAQQVPPKAEAGPGTAVVAPGVRKTRFQLDEIPVGTYDIITKETLVRYGIDHMGFSEFWGTFPGATGTLKFDPKAPGATKLDVKVPIALVETTNRELNGELFSDEFFDAENYPWMIFASKKTIRTGPTSFKVTGDLTMHNVTKSIVLEVTFHGAGNDPFSGKGIIIGFDAKGSVKRSEFGLGKYVPIVSDETTITVSAEFKARET